MGFSHFLGVVFGILVLAMSKLFWLNICFFVADSYETLSQATCGVFQTFFFWAGIIIIVVSVIGFFRKH